MNAKDLQRTLIYNLYTPDKVMVPNAHFAGGEMDLVIVSRAGYLHEYEIKVSLADWKADAKKDKWKSPKRKLVPYFWYAIPKTLWDKNRDRLAEVLPHVRDEYGIITFELVKEPKPFLSMWTARQATQLPDTEKLSKQDLEFLVRKGYHRYIESVVKDARDNWEVACE